MMISLRNITKTYFGNERVLDDVNLDIKKGEFFYVVGGTGAGKSSLLRLLATEETPSEGTLQIFGYDVARAPTRVLRGIRQAIGYVPQGLRLIPDLTVTENVALGLSTTGRTVRKDRARIDDLVERLGLGPKAGVLASQLSGGEAQRAAVARALIRAPELLIADEPTGAQDRESTWAMIDFFLKANSLGSAVILATHDREIVRRVRKRCAVLREGRLSLEEVPCTY